MQGKKWSTPERDERVIELYAQYESAIKVAETVGCGRTTVNNILVKYGIPRIGRSHGNGKKRKPKPEPKVKKSHCRSKYCPALIVMLYRCMGYKAKEIADITGYQKNGIQNVLSKRGLTNAKSRPKKSDFDLDQIEYEYVTLGTSSYELSKKYGIGHTTINKWMRQRGHHLGKGAHQKGSHKPELAERHKRAEKEFAKRLVDEFDGKFEYVGNFRANDMKFATIRCMECGHVFDHSIDFNGSMWTCPQCRQRQIEADRQRREEEVEQERETRRYERMFEEIREYALDKTCKGCGSTFHNANATAMYCSDKCRRRARDRNRRRQPNNFRHYYHVKYGENYRDHYDSSITLKKLYERDGGVCQICGEPCDWDDREWGSNGPMYPSVDHIVPRAKGGDHKWSNVQLAHCLCNSKKRDPIGDELQEVMDVA